MQTAGLCRGSSPGRAALGSSWEVQCPHLFVMRISWLEMLHSFWDTKYQIKGPGKHDAMH